MSYTVYLKRSAEKELARLPAKIHDRVVKRLISLRDNPRPSGAKKLLGREGMKKKGRLKWFPLPIVKRFIDEASS